MDNIFFKLTCMIILTCMICISLFLTIWLVSPGLLSAIGMEQVSVTKPKTSPCKILDNDDGTKECKVKMDDGRTVTCIVDRDGRSCDWKHAK